MGYHLTTADDVETVYSHPPAPSAKYTLCHRKPLRGPIFKWVLSTKYTDEETGLLYYGYRYYVPVLGRWTSKDPMKERGGFNLYAFCFNVPSFAIDGLGLNPLLEICGKCAGSVATEKIKEVVGQAMAKADFVKRIRELGCPSSPESGSISMPSYYEDFIKTDGVLASFGLCVMDEVVSKLLGGLYESIIKTKKLPPWLSKDTDLGKVILEAAGVGKEELKDELKKWVESSKIGKKLTLNYGKSNDNCVMNYKVNMALSFTMPGLGGGTLGERDEVIYTNSFNYDDVGKQTRSICEMCPCKKAK